MACGRALLNHQDGKSIGKALSVLTHNVKREYKDYDINRMHKEILMMLSLEHSLFGEPVSNLLRVFSSFYSLSYACSQASIVSPEYRIFMSIVKCIPDEPSRDVVQDAFEVLCGMKSFEFFKAPSS